MEVIAVVLFCLGISIGCCVMNFWWLRRTKGTFIIDCTDPNKDICRIELDNFDLDSVANEKYLVLKVDADIPVSRD